MDTISSLIRQLEPLRSVHWMNTHGIDMVLTSLYLQFGRLSFAALEVKEKVKEVKKEEKEEEKEEEEEVEEEEEETEFE
jgi:hypothetical protein